MKTSTKIWGISLITLFCFGKSFAQAPVVDFNWAPVSPCVGAPVAITGQTLSGTATAWGYSLTGATSPSYAMQNPATTFTMAGVQTITLVAFNGITPSAPVVHTLNVKAGPSMTVASTASTAVCPGTSATLAAVGASTYAWSAPLTSTAPTATITVPAMNTTYSVVGTGTNGCSATATVMQNVTPNPINVTGTSSVALCVNQSATLTASGGTTYAWQAPVTGTTSTAVITPTAAGNYSATVVAGSTVCAGYNWTTTVTQTVSTCVGIQSIAANKTSFVAYPNPTSADLTIELNNGAAKNISVMDLTGRIVLTKTSSEDVIHVNMSSLAKGIYYVRVQSNNAIETTKIVKE